MSETPAPGAGLADFVRAHDPDRFLTALFAPAPQREALFALYAFNYEVARVREIVSDAMIGQIRLQWWRDALDEIVGGRRIRAHEVVQPLAEALRRHDLPPALFERLLDARELDLDDQPPPSLVSLSSYLDGASGALIELAMRVLGTGEEGHEAAHAAGIGYGLAGLLRALPFHAGANRIYLPADLMSRHGIEREALTEGKAGPELTALVRELADHAGEHLAAARRAARDLPRAATPALLPVVVAEGWLKQLAAAGHDPFALRPERGLATLLRVGFSGIRGRL